MKVSCRGVLPPRPLTKAQRERATANDWPTRKPWPRRLVNNPASVGLNDPSALLARRLHPVNAPGSRATPREATAGRVDGDGLP
jgi:hypothetical protein